MSKISVAIPQQNFELIRDKIASILIVELANQHILQPSLGLDLPIYVNRLTPKKTDEQNFINVSYSGTNFDDRSTIQAVGDNVYYVDLFLSAADTSSQNGATISTLFRDRLAGIIRSIILNPVYKLLDFNAPSLNSVKVSSIEIPDPLSRSNDAKNSTMARVVVTVGVPETTSLISPTPIEASIAQLSIGNSNSGFKYEYEKE